LLEKENIELNEVLNEKSNFVLELLCKSLENENRIRELEKASNVNIYKGKSIEKVQPRQQRRKLKEVM
jgi:hypothetical protein